MNFVRSAAKTLWMLMIYLGFGAITGALYTNLVGGGGNEFFLFALILPLTAHFMHQHWGDMAPYNRSWYGFWMSVVLLTLPIVTNTVASIYLWTFEDGDAVEPSTLMVRVVPVLGVISSMLFYVLAKNEHRVFSRSA